MAGSIPALVKPELLVWARSSAKLSSAQAAERAKIDLHDLGEWEAGHELPSLAQLRELGRIYKRPLAVFFLAEPPLRFDAQREFRRLAGTVPGEESSKLVFALRWAAFRRGTAIELRNLLGTTPRQDYLRLGPKMDPEAAGTEIRQFLGVNWSTQMEWTEQYQALNGWRAAVERKDVLVFQTSTVPIKEMRATCIPDQPLPIILLNSKDNPHGRVFSLLHEFVHILLHAGGHRTSRMIGERSPEEQPLEVAANAFASATLLPASSFLTIATSFPRASRGDDDALRRFAQAVNLSPEVILRRLVTLNKASEAVYRSKRHQWTGTPWPEQAKSSGGPPEEIKIIARDGPRYTQLVMNAYDQRLISTNAASDYLGVKPRHFPNIRRELILRPTLTGA